MGVTVVRPRFAIVANATQVALDAAIPASIATKHASRGVVGVES